MWQRVFTFESKFHRKAWYASDPATRAGQTACEQRACARRAHNTLSTKGLCSRPPHNVRLSHRQRILCKMPGSQHQTCSERAMFSTTQAWTARSVAGGGAGKLVKLVRIRFNGGRVKPSCLGGSAEGVGIPKLSRTAAAMRGRVSAGVS